MTLAGANRNAEFVPSGELAHRTNYFKGSDATGWQTDVPNYQSVTAKNVYDGVDAVWQGKPDGEVQYDFVVAPHADASQLEWRVEGATDVSIEAASGDLIIETEIGTMRQRKPFTYQPAADEARTEIQSGYVIEEPKTKNQKPMFSASNLPSANTTAQNL